MEEGCPSLAGSILNQAQDWGLRWETSMWVEASWSGWLSHLVKLSSRSISIRKGGPWCLGLSPCDDRVHKCGQVQGTEAFSICVDSVGYHSCHSAGAGPPPLPTLPLETAATYPLLLFSHNMSLVTWQVFAERQRLGIPAGWGSTHRPSSCGGGPGSLCFQEAWPPVPWA